MLPTIRLIDRIFRDSEASGNVDADYVRVRGKFVHSAVGIEDPILTDRGDGRHPRPLAYW
jgi:hypothetical protein